MKTQLKYISILTIASIVIASCTKEKKQDPFQISKQHIGLLTDSTMVKDLDIAFPNDSIVTSIKGDEFAGDNNDIEIYKEGKKSLILTPSQALDSTAVIESVLILNEKYKTDKNISTLSTFKDINDNYKISSINNLISTVVVTVNEINASFTIDKKELPANLRFDMTLNIEAVQIPDNAKIKYFIVHW
ncbi:hypothetical protein [uncultured Psychroserpens sp.]|uniref:hypothetical protein n=1 Tax=uncultured Psychroserpens sp. TaxID=255436 RepID=UPI002603385E|nr:hypothetical protein [uncultured Psychroserpens sp.]